MPKSRLHELVEQGLYLDAANASPNISAPTIDDQILRLWIELHVGDPAAAHRDATKLLDGNLSGSDRVRVLNVKGRALLYSGKIEESTAILRQAVRAAEALGDSVLVARSHVQLAKAVLQWICLDAQLPELAHLRRVSHAAGDVQSLVEFHCLAAEFNMKRRRTATALQHLRIARSLCEHYENFFFRARVLTLEANAAILTGSRETALEKSRLALDYCDRSGSKMALGPALSTFAHAALLEGHFSDAEKAFARMFEVAPLRPASTLMAQDGLLQLALMMGDKQRAETLASEIWTAIETYRGPAYYVLWHVPTRIRWLLDINRAKEALETVRKYLPDAIQSADSNLADTLRLLEAEATATCGDISTASSLLSNAVHVIEEMTPDNAAAIERTIARICSVMPDQAISESGQSAANPAAVRNETVHDAFGTASGLIDMAMDPLLLARRIGSLLIGLKAASAAVLIKSRNQHSRVLGSFGCDREQSWQITNDGNAIAMHAGGEGDHKLELYVIPATDAGARIRLLSIERLLKAAVTVREARLRRRDEITLWASDDSVEQLGMVCSTEQMRDLVSVTRRVAQSTATVLFTGETGTGKELLARALHESSPRREKPFIPFNCSAVARDMLDSQLFGYRRGAFTGAQEGFLGVIRAAAGGTLFLDEIGEISLEVQPKLLRFLESGEIHPLGEPKPMQVDVRIVAATNANLEQLVEQGRFREDLFYRLNVVRLQVPPLRERREEIPLLVQHYLDKYSRESQKTGLQLAEETMEYLVLFKWPGNVRQLANEIRRLVALAESGAVLMPEHLSHEIAASRRTIPASERQLAPTEFVVRLDQPISAAIEHVERAMIQHALAKADGSMEDAAQALGLSRKGLYLKRQRMKALEEGTLVEPAEVVDFEERGAPAGQ